MGGRGYSRPSGCIRQHVYALLRLMRDRSSEIRIPNVEENIGTSEERHSTQPLLRTLSFDGSPTTRRKLGICIDFAVCGWVLFSPSLKPPSKTEAEVRRGSLIIITSSGLFQQQWNTIEMGIPTRHVKSRSGYLPTGTFRLLMRPARQLAEHPCKSVDAVCFIPQRPIIVFP